MVPARGVEPRTEALRACSDALPIESRGWVRSVEGPLASWTGRRQASPQLRGCCDHHADKQPAHNFGMRKGVVKEQLSRRLPMGWTPPYSLVGIEVPDW